MPWTECRNAHGNFCPLQYPQLPHRVVSSKRHLEEAKCLSENWENCSWHLEMGTFDEGRDAEGGGVMRGGAVTSDLSGSMTSSLVSLFIVHFPSFFIPVLPSSSSSSSTLPPCGSCLPAFRRDISGERNAAGTYPGSTSAANWSSFSRRELQRSQGWERSLGSWQSAFI